MAALDIFRPAATGRSVGGRISQFTNSAFGTLANWRQTNATRRALSKLSDHELEDIGLSRGDIEEISVDSYR